jgi:hypothetical protein
MFNQTTARERERERDKTQMTNITDQTKSMQMNMTRFINSLIIVCLFVVVGSTRTKLWGGEGLLRTIQFETTM